LETKAVCSFRFGFHSFKVNAIVFFFLKVLAASAHIPGVSMVSMLSLVAGRGKFSYVPLPVSLTVEFTPWWQDSGCSQQLTVLRACPPEDQAEVIHAISPISVKLGQIEGHTQ